MATQGDFRARFAAAFDKASKKETLNEAAVSRDDVIKQFKISRNMDKESKR